MQGNRWRFSHDLADSIDEVDRLCRAEPVATDLAAHPQNDEAIRAVLQKHLSLAQLKEYRGPAYWIPEGAQVAGGAVVITEANAELLGEHFAWMLPLLPNLPMVLLPP